METTKSWHEVKHIDDPADKERIVSMARKRYEDAVIKDGFAVFSRTLLDYAKPREAFRSYYFSPDASKECAGALISLRAKECDKPSESTDEDEPRLKLEVGDPETAWDLLK